MIEVIKNKIWDLLKEKDVSLAMIYDIRGNILWSKGRPIIGKTIEKGRGFAKSYIQRAYIHGDTYEDTGSVLLSDKEGAASKSASYLRIRSLLILRISDNYFLYIDSGTKEIFTSSDVETFRVLGEVLGDVIRRIRMNETDADGVTGKSEAINKIREQIVAYSMVNDPVLLTGETGTGKTHIAQLIHHYSGRGGKFKLIHAPGIPENLFESEMFGHKKGAFTDAKLEKKGLVEEADGGTLFVDEITEVSVAMQAKLLRFIETGSFTPLGHTRERHVNVRVVAATNRNLKQAIHESTFRDDLYYRLNVFQIELPPLRERKRDLEDLVNEKRSFLNGKRIGKGFWDAIYDHQWPGNVRELFSVLKRAGVCPTDVITGEDIRSIIGSDSVNGNGPVTNGITDPGTVLNMWDQLSRGENFWDVAKKPYLSRDLKRSEIRSLIAMGLAETRGKYKDLLPIFNLESKDYHRFMRFLHEQELLPQS